MRRPRSAPSAERMPNSFARDAARRQGKIRDVGACDQQHQCDCGEQHQQPRAHVTHHVILERHYIDVCVPGCRHPPGKKRAHARLKQTNLRRRLLQREARAQTPITGM